MKKIYDIAGVLMLIAFFACTETNDKTQKLTEIMVPVEKETAQVNLSDFASATVVPLETTDSTLLNEISDLYVVRDYIYVSDGSALYKYDMDGRLAGCIKRQGEGPEEYIHINHFQIDKDGNAWILSNNNRSLNRYSWDNRLQQHIDLELATGNICLLNDDKMILYVRNQHDENNLCQLHELNLTSGKIEAEYKPIDLHQSKYLFLMKELNVLRKSADEPGTALFSQNFNDTIYSIRQASCAPAFRLNYNGKNVPASFYAGDYQNIMDFFNHLFEGQSYAYGSQFFLEQEDAYWVSYYYRQNCYWAILPKVSGDALISNKLTIDYPLEGYTVDLSSLTCFAQDNNTVVLPLPMFDINEYATTLDKEKANRLRDKVRYASEDQNPVVLIVKPK